MSGYPRQGGTNYNKWDKITNKLVNEAEEDEKLEKEKASEALGHNRVAYSAAQAEEKAKAEMARKAKEALDQHRQRESNATAFLDKLFPKDQMEESENIVEETEDLQVVHEAKDVVVDESMLGKKRVVSIRNCHGPGSVILPSNLSNLSSSTTIDGKESLSVQGVIKIFIHNCHDCTIRIQCKIITSMVEISHCSNVTVLVEGERISTIQADLSQYLIIRFMGDHCFGGKDDKIYHAGVSNTKIQIMDGEQVKKETSIDYLKDGAVPQLNFTAEEYQFITHVYKGDFLTERLIRMGNKSMTQREIDEDRLKKRQSTVSSSSDGASFSADEINEYTKQCITHKAEGNEAFKAGEYAQAVLHYSMSIDKSNGLDKAIKQLETKENVSHFEERHIVFANRSACFLKLGHHDKALADAEACIGIDPNYVKGLFRKGLALHAMKRYQEAMSVLSSALKIEPKNKQIKQALQFAEVKFTMMMRKRME